jgi:hypothetical protein
MQKELFERWSGCEHGNIHELGIVSTHLAPGYSQVVQAPVAEPGNSSPYKRIFRKPGRKIASLFSITKNIFDDPAAWSIEEGREVPLKELDDPASLVVQGKTEPFRHGLDQLKIDGVKLPVLTICVEPDSLSFDYRMGSDWGRYEVSKSVSTLSVLPGEKLFLSPTKRLDKLFRSRLFNVPVSTSLSSRF